MNGDQTHQRFASTEKAHPVTRKSKFLPPLGGVRPERPAERQPAMESNHLSEEEAPEHPPARSPASTRAMRRSQRLSDNRWLLWVDSRRRITIPKALRDLEDWRDCLTTITRPH